MLKKPLSRVTRHLSGSILVAAALLVGTHSAWAASAGSAGRDATHAVAAPMTTQVTPAGALTPPSYPASAVARRISGMVVLELLVGVDGDVKDVKVRSSKPPGVFDQVAIDAASKWKFNAATSHGKAVAKWVRVPLEFSPDSRKKSATAG